MTTISPISGPGTSRSAPRARSRALSRAAAWAGSVALVDWSTSDLPGT